MDNLFDFFLDLYVGLADYIQFELAGNIWLVVGVFVYYLLVLAMAYSESQDKYNMPTPFPRLKLLLYTTFSGLFGGNLVVQAGKYQSKVEALWMWISVLSFPIVLLFIAFDLFNDQYKWVSIILLLDITYNIVYKLIRIPQDVARINSLYFRRHVETDLILGGEQLPVEGVTDELGRLMRLFEETIDVSTEIAKDEGRVTVQVEKSFFRNLLTFGSFNDMQKEKARLVTLVKVSKLLQVRLSKHKEFCEALDDHLAQYRKAAFRNIYLCKELLSLLKTLKGSQQVLVKDMVTRLPTIEYVDDSSLAQIDNVVFNSEEIVDGCIVSVGNALGALSDKYNSGYEITKTDVQVAAIEVALETLIESVGAVIALNSSVAEQRKKIQEGMSAVVSYLDNALPKMTDYRISVLRKIELVIALSEMHKAFVRQYEPIRANVFDDKGGLKKDALSYLEEFSVQEKLALLIDTCRTYSNINRASV